MICAACITIERRSNRSHPISHSHIAAVLASHWCAFHWSHCPKMKHVEIEGRLLPHRGVLEKKIGAIGRRASGALTTTTSFYPIISFIVVLVWWRYLRSMKWIDSSNHVGCWAASWFLFGMFFILQKRDDQFHPGAPDGKHSEHALQCVMDYSG